MNKIEQRNWDLSGIQIEAAVNYLVKKGALPSRRSAPKVIGRDIPACPPLEEPLWEHHKAQFGFILPDRLVRFAWVA